MLQMSRCRSGVCFYWGFEAYRCWHRVAFIARLMPHRPAGADLCCFLTWLHRREFGYWVGVLAALLNAETELFWFGELQQGFIVGLVLADSLPGAIRTTWRLTKNRPARRCNLKAELFHPIYIQFFLFAKEAILVGINSGIHGLHFISRSAFEMQSSSVRLCEPSAMLSRRNTSLLLQGNRLKLSFRSLWGTIQRGGLV